MERELGMESGSGSVGGVSVGVGMSGCAGRECRRGIVGERVWGWECGGWSVQVNCGSRSVWSE